MAQNGTAAGTAKTTDREIFLSEILNVPVMIRGKKTGILSDLIVVETARIPEVKSLYVTRSFGTLPDHPLGERSGSGRAPYRYRYPRS